jgi:hypothetical protein
MFNKKNKIAENAAATISAQAQNHSSCPNIMPASFYAISQSPTA